MQSAYCVRMQTTKQIAKRQLTQIQHEMLRADEMSNFEFTRIVSLKNQPVTL